MFGSLFIFLIVVIIIFFIEQQELTYQLGALPLRNDTFRIRTCKQELETKLAELEEAIKIFSRPKVFVKID